MRRAMTGAAVVAVLVAPAAALGAPAIMPGWPVPAPGGPVPGVNDLLPGPDGGVAAIGWVDSAYIVAAYRRDGTRRWASVQTPGCGNCAEGGPEPSARADGSYGPIGPVGSGSWDVDRTGRVVRPGCAGIVMAGGICVKTLGIMADPDNLGLSPTVTATRDDVTVWTHVEADLVWRPELSAYPPAVIDRGGQVYAAFGDALARSGAPRVLALDAANGSLRWRVAMTGRVVAGLDHGVLVSGADGAVIAFDANGGERWRLPAEVGGAQRAVLDMPRGRVIVQTGPSGSGRIAAVNLADGAVRWLTPPGAAATGMSLGRTGTVYAALGGEDTAHGVRAVRAAGTVAWTLPTAAPVGGVVELSDGTVVVSTDIQENALLTRVDPRHRAARVRIGRVDASPRRIRIANGCYPNAWRRRDCGTIVRFRLPAAATVSLRSVPGYSSSPTVVHAPAGTSVVRFPYVASIATRITATWTERGRRRVVGIPVTTVGDPRS